MRVDVIIPTVGRVATLPRAIQSVVDQTYRPVNLWVVGDGIPQGIWSAINQSWTIDGLYRTSISLESRNLPEAANDFGASPRNWALRASQSPLIAYLDDDDEWMPDHLEKAVRQITDGADVTFGGYIVHLPCGKKIPVIPSDEPKLGIFAGVGMVHKRSALDGIEPPWESQDCHDFMLIRKMMEKGAIIRAIKEPVFHYYVSSDRFSVQPDEGCEGIDYCKVDVIDDNKE